LPYDILTYAPVITFRSNVSSICKSNSVDYLENVQKVDYIKQTMHVNSKNIDMIKRELDFHIPLKYFNSKLFNNSIFLIAYKCKNKYCLIIADNLKKNSNNYSCTCMYERRYKEIDSVMFQKVSFEILFNRWIKIN
jgi:hypothetical protein